MSIILFFFQIIHSNVVDTSVIYTKLGRKVALKHLAKEELNEKIQDGGNYFVSYHVQHWFNILWEQILEVKSLIM